MTPPKRRPGQLDGPDPRYYHDGRYAPPDRVLKRAMKPPRPRRSRLGWPIVALGLAVFVVGWIGAQTMAVHVPGDPHHVLSQFLGAGIVFVGLGLVQTRKRR